MKSTCAMILNEEWMGLFPLLAAQVILKFVCLGILTKLHQFQPLIGFVKTWAQGPELRSVLATCHLHRKIHRQILFCILFIWWIRFVVSTYNTVCHISWLCPYRNMFLVIFFIFLALQTRSSARNQWCWWVRPTTTTKAKDSKPLHNKRDHIELSRSGVRQSSKTSILHSDCMLTNAEAQKPSSFFFFFFCSCSFTCSFKAIFQTYPLGQG